MDLLHHCNIAALEVRTDFDLPLVVNVENILVLLGIALGAAA
jgi:hypothetical protein